MYDFQEIMVRQHGWFQTMVQRIMQGRKYIRLNALKISTLAKNNKAEQKTKSRRKRDFQLKEPDRHSISMNFQILCMELEV